MGCVLHHFLSLNIKDTILKYSWILVPFLEAGLGDELAAEVDKPYVLRHLVEDFNNLALLYAWSHCNVF